MSEKTGLLEKFHDTPLNYHGIVVCRPITGRRFAMTAISPMYVVRRLTEEFGPCGIGWGLNVKAQGFERLDNETVLHWVHVVLWYIHEDKRGEIEHIGCTLASYQSSAGPVRDEDAPKKSVTDALTKAASLLGIGFDVHAGLADSKYEQGGVVKAPDATFPPIEEIGSPEAATDALVKWIKSAERAQLRSNWTRIQLFYSKLQTSKRTELAAQIDAAIQAAKTRFGLNGKS